MVATGMEVQCSTSYCFQRRRMLFDSTCGSTVYSACCRSVLTWDWPPSWPGSRSALPVDLARMRASCSAGPCCRSLGGRPLPLLRRGLRLHCVYRGANRTRVGFYAFVSEQLDQLLDAEALVLLAQQQRAHTRDQGCRRDVRLLCGDPLFDRGSFSGGDGVAHLDVDTTGCDEAKDSGVRAPQHVCHEWKPAAVCSTSRDFRPFVVVRDRCAS